ncbi:hypothetical protein ACFRFQ_01515 [Rhodococcus sp. NPDC056743]
MSATLSEFLTVSEFEIATSGFRLGQDGIVLPYPVCQEARHDL